MATYDIPRGIFQLPPAPVPDVRAFRSKKLALAPFVTISRQSGTGGHDLASAVMKALGNEPRDPALQGWLVYDREICDKILQDRKLKANLDMLLSEQYRPAIEDYIFEMFSEQPSQATIYYELSRMVRTVALAGKAIIVGRFGACCTQDLTGGLHVRLVASEKTRITAVAKEQGLTEKRARERVRETDQARAKNAKAHFKRDIEDPLLYTATWNLDRVPIPLIASFIVSWIKREASVL